MNGSSEILRYPTIALVDILRTAPVAWTTDPSNPLNERRKVNVQARVIVTSKAVVPAVTLPSSSRRGAREPAGRPIIMAPGRRWTWKNGRD